MSVDENAAKELVETLKDGRTGFADAADKLAESDRPEWAQTLRRFAQQRADFAQEIVDLGHKYGDDVDESGSALASAHRGWMALKDAVTGSDPAGVLDAALQGEDHTLEEYDKALNQDLSDGFRTVVARQNGEINAARDEVRALKSTT